MGFERFDAQARLTIVLAQEECRLLGHQDIGADHLLLGVARVDEAILAIAPERLREVIARRRGARVAHGSPEAVPFSGEAMTALALADDQATSRDHTQVRPGHVLLALLAAGDTASRILSALGVSRDTARVCAEHATENPATPRAPAPPRSGMVVPIAALDEGRFEDAVRDGHPIMVRLHNAPPLGDVGNALVDARLLKVILAADGHLARMLRAHGVDESAIDAALKPPA